MLIAAGCLVLACYYILRAYFSVPHQSTKGEYNYPHDYDLDLIFQTKDGRYFYDKSMKMFKIFAAIAGFWFLIFLAAEIFSSK